MREKSLAVAEPTEVARPAARLNSSPVIEINATQALHPISELEIKKERLERELEAISSSGVSFILVITGIVALALELVLVDPAVEVLSRLLPPGQFPDWIFLLGIAGRVALLWGFTILLLSLIYFFRIKAPTDKLRKKIKENNEQMLSGESGAAWPLSFIAFIPNTNGSVSISKSAG